MAKPAADAYMPPHSIEAEQALLGAVFVEPACLNEVSLIVPAPDMFFRDSHRHIYRAMQSLSARGAEIDWVTVLEEVRKHGLLDACGGHEALQNYLSEVSHAVPSAFGAESYAATVRDRATLRAVIQAAGAVRQSALDPTMTAARLVEDLEKRVFEIAAQRYHGVTKTMGDTLPAVMDQLQRMVDWRMRHQDAALPGLSSGWTDLNQYTTGWKPGELIIVGARPGQGKTSLALNIAENVATETMAARNDGKGGVLFFSLEMTGMELVQRVLCTYAGVDAKRAKLGVLSSDETHRMKEGAKILKDAPLYVDDSFTLNMSEIRSKSRRMREAHGVELILVDYLQLIKENDRLDRHLQIGNISRGLKALARELEIPVIAMAQLNRGVEQRSRYDKRPMLSDLRESGSIEQDSDQVIMIYHQPPADDSTDERDPVPVDLIVAKNRNGPTGDVKMLFHKKTTKFTQVTNANRAAFSGGQACG